MVIDSCLAVALLAVAFIASWAANVVQEQRMEAIKHVLLFGISCSCVCSFTSAYLQIAGLISHKGLIPITDTMKTVSAFLWKRKDEKKKWRPDMIIRYMIQLVHEKYSHSTEAKDLRNSLMIDIILSFVSLVFPNPLIYLYLYVSYFSLKRVGGQFFNFQWDALLLEAIVLSTLLAMSYDEATICSCIWLFRILLFRLMFGSGVVKIFSRDKSWHTDYSAMSYHFLTQPLPSYLGRIAHVFLPFAVFKVMTVGTLFVECIIPPLALWGVRSLDLLVFVCYAALQLSISATGYYGFFNYLSVVISVCLLNDTTIHSIMHSVCGRAFTETTIELMSLHGYYSSSSVKPLAALALLSQAGAALVVYPALLILSLANLMALYKLAHRSKLIATPLNSAAGTTPEPEMSTSRNDQQGVSLNAAYLYQVLHKHLSTLASLHDVLLHSLFIGNHYGLFETMTKSRNEMVIELSKDKCNWEEVHFIAKPDDPYVGPKRIFPFFHLPRLDWMMWFLALRPVKEMYPKWLWYFIIAIMEGQNEDVLALLHSSHSSRFPAGEYKYVRIQLVSYRFKGAFKEDDNVGNATPEADSSSPNEESRVSSGRFLYWSTKKVREILPPTTLVGVHQLLDNLDERIIQRRKERQAPTPETAKDIIMRTLFAKLAKDRRNEEKKQD